MLFKQKKPITQSSQAYPIRAVPQNGGHFFGVRGGAGMQLSWPGTRKPFTLCGTNRLADPNSLCRRARSPAGDKVPLQPPAGDTKQLFPARDPGTKPDALGQDFCILLSPIFLHSVSVHSAFAQERGTARLCFPPPATTALPDSFARRCRSALML